MEKYLGRLRKAIIKKISEQECTLTSISDKCDISYRELCNILNGKTNDIKMSTFIKICENLGIAYSEILGTGFEDEKILSKITVSLNGKNYILKEDK